MVKDWFVMAAGACMDTLRQLRSPDLTVMLMSSMSVIQLRANAHAYMCVCNTLRWMYGVTIVRVMPFVVLHTQLGAKRCALTHKLFPYRIPGLGDWIELEEFINSGGLISRERDILSSTHQTRCGLCHHKAPRRVGRGRSKVRSLFKKKKLKTFYKKHLCHRHSNKFS